MKLILQIAFGVFIGMSASQFLIDAWRTHRQEQVAEAEGAKREQLARERQEQAERIRQMVSRKLQQQGTAASAETSAEEIMPQEPEEGDAAAAPAAGQP